MTENKDKKNFIGGNNNKNGKPKINSYWWIVIVGASLLFFNILGSGSDPKTIFLKKFNELVKNQEIEKITIIRNKGKANIYLKKSAIPNHKDVPQGTGFFSGGSGPHYQYKYSSAEVFDNNLKEAQKDIESKIYYDVKEETSFFDSIISFLPIILIIVIWLYFFRRMSKGPGGGGGNIFSVGKSKAKLFDKESNIKVSFKDVAGLAEAKTEVEEIVDFLKSPEKYTKLGGKIPKGALLVGPPGTGKTLLAKAVAGEANVPFFSMSGSDFVEMFVGVGASRVRDLFKQAKEKSPCIIFIDEIDAIGRARGKNPNMGANDERENTLNQLLTEMDGFDTNSGVIILAATNRADILDRALMRAGRFDRQIHVELPDLNERKEIFEVHLRPLKISKELDTEFLSKQTPGFSGADIANACNESALIAARRSKKLIDKQDFLDAVDRIIGGLEKKNKIISRNEKKTIAYHEAGHASVSWLLKHAHPLVKVTIVPRGKALGAAWYLPEERQITTREQLLDEMCATLAGRAAEELAFGTISTGAQNDLERVTKQAIAMISYFGMSDKVGNVSYYDSQGGDYGFTKPYSEKTAELIDQEVKQLIEVSYERAKEVLSANEDGHRQVAELLLEKEVLFAEDLERIFGKREEDIEKIKEDKKDKEEDTSTEETN